MAEVKVKLLWSQRAVADLDEIIAYLAQDSPAAARNFATKIIDAVEVIATFPEVGRIVPEYKDGNIREILYRNYRVVYELSENTAILVTVFHGSRLFEG